MLRWLWLSGAIIVLDQISKVAAEHWLDLHTANPVLPYFNLTLVYNYGAAFSFLSNAGGWQRWFFTALAVLISLFILFWIKKLGKTETWVAASLALILGGAVGNVIDRILYGYVIDFLDVYYGTWHWPTFNIADSAITVGATILIVNSLFAKTPRSA